MSTVPPSDQPDERSGEGSAISDEQWDAFLRESVEGGGAPSPKEPSARARMVTRQLREQAAAERSGRPGRRWRLRGEHRTEHQAPVSWRTGPARQEVNGRRSSSRQLGSALGVALALALAVVAVRPSLLLDRFPGHDSVASEPSPSRLPAETSLPSTAPGEADQAGLPTRDHPFLGSPAQRWADGAEAIELPVPKAVPGLSEHDVALALRRTKDFLVASNLDPAVLHGEQPDEALALLEPKQPALLSQLRRSLHEPTRSNDPVALFSRFDPQEVDLAGDVIKVRGHMTFTAARRGEVRVHADYTFVYPLVKAHGSDAGDALVARTVIRRDLTMTLADPHRLIATEGRLLLEKWDARYYNDECGVHDGYFHPTFPAETPTGAPPTGPAEDPYDRSRPLSDDQESNGTECGTISRS